MLILNQSFEDIIKFIWDIRWKYLLEGGCLSLATMLAILLAGAHSQVMTSTHYHPVVVTADSETAVSSFLEKNMGFIEAEMNRLDYLNEDNLTRELGEKED